MTMQPPVAVSPFIRFWRYSFLTAGIIYGAVNHRRLKKKETAFRAVEAEQKANRDAEMAVIRARQIEDERKAIAMLSR